MYKFDKKDLINFCEVFDKKYLYKEFKKINLDRGKFEEKVFYLVGVGALKSKAINVSAKQKTFEGKFNFFNYEVEFKFKIPNIFYITTFKIEIEDGAREECSGTLDCN